MCVSHLAQSSVTAALYRFGFSRQDECGLADLNQLPQIELTSPIHALVHSTWSEELYDRVQHFSLDFHNNCTLELSTAQEFMRSHILSRIHTQSL